MRSQRKQICAAVVVQLVAVVDVDVVGVILMTSRVVKWWWFSRRYGILQSMRCCSSGGGESLPSALSSWVGRTRFVAVQD